MTEDKVALIRIQDRGMSQLDLNLFNFTVNDTDIMELIKTKGEKISFK